jgi:hypothetical protein
MTMFKTANRVTAGTELSLTFALRQPYGLVSLFSSAQNCCEGTKKSKAWFT